MRLTALHSALLVVGLVGCNADEERDPHGGIALDDAPTEIAKAVCPRAYDCCTSAQLAPNDQAGTDEPSCELKTTQGFRNHLNTIKNSQKQGRVVYRGDRLAACLAYIRSASCQELNRTDHFSGLACEPYTEAKVSPGGVCGHDFECIGGHCAKAMDAAQGVCEAGEAPAPPARGTAPVVAGEKCFYSSACAFGDGRGRPRGSGLFLVIAAALASLVWRRRSGPPSRHGP